MNSSSLSMLTRRSAKVNSGPVLSQSSSSERRLDDVLEKIRKEIRSAVKQSGVTAVKSRFDTSDIVQESMIQIWKQLTDDDIPDIEFTRGLLSVIAKGHASNLRRSHLTQKRTVNREQSSPRPAQTKSPGPLDNAMIREQIGLMLNALNFIHPVRQLIIFRRFFDDASYQAIATELCRSKEWVRRQCLSAQKEIRILLMHRS